MTSKPIRTATTIVLGLLLFACSDGGNQVTRITLGIVPPVVPSTGVAVTEPLATTTAAPSTAVESTQPPTTAAATTTGDELSGPMFSDALGVKVDTAPGINTRGDTRQLLPEGLYVHIAWESDPNDLSVFSPIPEDIPILEAYANALSIYYRAASTDVTTDHPGFDLYYADGGALLDKAFSNARGGGYVLSLGAGVVLRPYVLEDRRTESAATVLDCYLEDQIYYLRNADPPASGVLEPRGQIVTMKIVDNVWMVDEAGEETQACM